MTANSAASARSKASDRLLRACGRLSVRIAIGPAFSRRIGAFEAGDGSIMLRSGCEAVLDLLDSRPGAQFVIDRSRRAADADRADRLIAELNENAAGRQDQAGNA